MSTLSLHCSGMGIMNEFQMLPDLESWWGLLPAKPKERAKGVGAAPVGHFLCARHYGGFVGVRPHPPQEVAPCHSWQNQSSARSHDSQMTRSVRQESHPLPGPRLLFLTAQMHRRHRTPPAHSQPCSETSRMFLRKVESEPGP